MAYESFSDYCFSTLVAFGHITGHFEQNEGYFFSYDNEEMKKPVSLLYAEFRNSIRSIYTPINSNPYSVVRDKNAAKKEENKLSALTKNEFSELCQWVYKSKEFAAILLLIIESLGTLVEKCER